MRIAEFKFRLTLEEENYGVVKEIVISELTDDIIVVWNVFEIEQRLKPSTSHRMAEDFKYF